MKNKLKKGYIQVYTGNGKGKTTAAVGLGLRGWGQGLNVCIIQFMKKNSSSGFYKAARKLGKRFVLKQFGTGKFTRKGGKEERQLAKQALLIAEKAISSIRYDILILDEINCALKWKLITAGEVKALLDKKISHIEVVLTGRYAPLWLLKKADLITEMKEQKHYFSQRVAARHGIEY